MLFCKLIILKNFIWKFVTWSLNYEWWLADLFSFSVIFSSERCLSELQGIVSLFVDSNAKFKLWAEC